MHTYTYMYICIHALCEQIRGHKLRRPLGQDELVGAGIVHGRGRELNLAWPIIRVYVYVYIYIYIYI